MGFWPYCFKQWNCDLIIPMIGILMLSFQSLEFWGYRFEQWNRGSIVINIVLLTLSFLALEFWPFLYKHCKAFLIVPNIGILNHFYEHCNSHLSLSPFGILALLLWTLTFWFYPYRHWNSGLFDRHWNSDLIIPNIGILILSVLKSESRIKIFLGTGRREIPW